MTTRLPRRGDAGFSIVEVVVAMFVFALVAVAALNMIIVTLRTTQVSAARTAAAHLASRQIEAIRTSRASDIPTGLTTYPKTVGATTFTVRQTSSWVTNLGTASACDGPSGTLSGKLVSVTVTWPGMGKTVAPKVETIVATDPVAESVNQSGRGAIALAVKDAGGSAVPDIEVTLTPGNVKYTTGDDGCLVYTNLTVGTYSVAANTAGYVGTTSAQSTTVGSLGVLAGAVTKGTLYYSPGASLDISLNAPTGTVVPSTLQVNVGASQMTDRILPLCPGTPTYACISAQPLGTAQKLYPDMYTVWAGKCLDPAASSSITADVRAVPSGTAAIPVGVLTATVMWGGLPEPNATVTLTRQSLNTSTPATCANTEVHTVPVGATGTAQIALPYGKWQVKGPGGTSTQVVSLTSTTTTASAMVLDTSH